VAENPFVRYPTSESDRLIGGLAAHIANQNSHSNTGLGLGLGTKNNTLTPEDAFNRPPTMQDIGYSEIIHHKNLNPKPSDHPRVSFQAVSENDHGDPEAYRGDGRPYDGYQTKVTEGGRGGLCTDGANPSNTDHFGKLDRSCMQSSMLGSSGAPFQMSYVPKQFGTNYKD
jgi:hypothetical protein